MENMDIIASGYEWLYDYADQKPRCGYLNRQPEWTSILVCKRCGRTYKANPPEHAMGR